MRQSSTTSLTQAEQSPGSPTLSALSATCQLSQTQAETQTRIMGIGLVIKSSRRTTTCCALPSTTHLRGNRKLLKSFFNSSVKMATGSVKTGASLSTKTVKRASSYIRSALATLRPSCAMSLLVARRIILAGIVSARDCSWT